MSIKLNLELKGGQLLNTDMNAFEKFLTEISIDDVIDIHNLTTKYINKKYK